MLFAADLRPLGIGVESTSDLLRNSLVFMELLFARCYCLIFLLLSFEILFVCSLTPPVDAPTAARYPNSIHRPQTMRSGWCGYLWSGVVGRV